MAFKRLTMLLWAAALAAAQQPTLIFRQAPSGEVLQDSLVTFAVAPLAPGAPWPADCALWRSPSQAGNQKAGHNAKLDAKELPAPDSVGRLYQVRPSDSGAAGPKLGLGFHFLVAACGDGTQVSPEIPLLVVSRQSASILAPKALEASSRPAISWTPVPGVPAYHLLLSDQALDIDTEKGTVGGASIIWQAITTKTSIAYGTPDPSGTFTKVSPPPLSPGVTYNLVVLNNYDGRSALATSSKAQALKLFSIQAPAAPLSKPVNLHPAQGRLLGVSTDSTIAFRWSASKSSAGAANTYDLFIYSLEEGEGSEILVPILSREVTDTAVAVDAKRSLLDKRYVWKVFAKGSDGSSTVGDTTSFTYRNDVRTLSLTVTGAGPTGGTVPLGDVRIEVTPLDGGANAIPLFTPSNGHVVKQLTAGSYSLLFSKDGYVGQTRVVTLSAADTTAVDQLLPAAASRLTGRVTDAGGLGLDNVKVTAAAADRSVTGQTDASGYFLLGVAAGSHALSFAKADWQSPPDTVVAVKAGEAKDIGKVALAQPKGALSGTVTNDKGQPLPACQVLIKTPAGAAIRALLTDDKGGFSAWLAPGQYVVAASRTGFTTEERALRLTDAATVTLQLAAGASVLRGRIDLKTWPSADEPASSPLPGAALELKEMFTGAVQKGESDLRGEYTFSADTGTYLLKASRPGRAAPESSLVKIARQRSTLAKDLELRGFASVQGTLALNPAPPAAVDPSTVRVSLLRSPSLELAASAAASYAPAGGLVFSVDGVPDGAYRVACGLPGYGLASEPTVTVRDGVWIRGVALALEQATRFATFTLRHGARSVPGAVRLAAPLQAEARSGARIGPAATGTYILSAAPDSLPLIPVSRHTFSLVPSSPADTNIPVTLPFPFSHVPPREPLRFNNGLIEVALGTLARVDSAWIVHGYGAPADTFRVPSNQLVGFVDEPKILRFNPGPQGGSLTYFFILRMGSTTYANDAPDRRFRATVEASRELAFLRLSAGDSLSLPARSQVGLTVHAYDAAGRRIDTAVDARGRVTWSVEDVEAAEAGSRRGRALTVATGRAPLAAEKRSAGGAGASAWDSLRVTVSLDGLEQALAVPARVVPHTINRLALTSSLGETPEIPSPAPFSLFVTGYDTTVTPPAALVPSPAFTLDPPEAGTVAGLEVIPSPRFIGPLRVLAVHVNPDGTRAATELGARRDSSLRGVNVGQTLRPGDTARLFVHDGGFELRIPDSAFASEGQAVLRMHRRQVAKTFASGVDEALSGRLYEVANPSGAAFTKVLRLNLGVPAAATDRVNALRRFEAAGLEWAPLGDSAEADTTVFGEPSLAADITLLDGNYYGLLGRSKPLSAGDLEILPNPFSPLVTATRDGNTRPGARIRFRPESDRSAEVTVTLRVYNMDGELIRTLADHKTLPKAPAEFYWDGKTDGGRWARNGRYLLKLSLSATGSWKVKHVIRPVVVFR